QRFVYRQGTGPERPGGEWGTSMDMTRLHSTRLHLTRRSFGMVALGAIAGKALAKAPFAGAQAPGIYRTKVGAFEITVLNDGWLPIEEKLFSGDAASAPQLLAASFLPADAIPTAVNEWLVNTGDKLVLIDTGTSDLFGPTLGRMAKNLAAAGV